MDLHLHLSVAFRALDRKWGKPVELDSSEESSFQLPCLPAVIERPTTTFSSEEFIRTRKTRPKPYSRHEVRRRKENIKTNDSFADISSSRIPNGDGEASSIDSGLDQESTVTRLVDEMSRSHGVSSCESLDSVLDSKKIDKALKPCLKQWKHMAKSFIGKNCKRIIKS